MQHPMGDQAFVRRRMSLLSCALQEPIFQPHVTLLLQSLQRLVTAAAGSSRTTMPRALKAKAKVHTNNTRLLSHWPASKQHLYNGAMWTASLSDSSTPAISGVCSAHGTAIAHVCYTCALPHRCWLQYTYMISNIMFRPP